MLHDPQLSWAVTAVNAPVVEERLLRGALLTGLLYILGVLRTRSDPRYSWASCSLQDRQ